MRRVVGISIVCLFIIGSVLVMAGCGSGSPVTTAAPTSTTAASAPSTTASTASADTTTPPTAPQSSAPSGKPGSRGNPIPLNTKAAVGTWEITVPSADLQADAAVKSAPNYQTPDPGTQFVLVNLTATNTGTQQDSFANGLGYQIVGSKGDTFDTADLGLDKSIDGTDAVPNGGTVSGPLVFEVKSDQVDGATLWVAPSSAAQETGVFFALK